MRVFRVATIVVASLIITSAVAIIPSLRQVDETAERCMDIMDASAAARVDFRAHRYPDTRESHLHLYCLDVFSDFFSERFDYDLRALYGFLPASMSWEKFVDWVERCYAERNVEQVGLCRYERMFRMYKCFEDMWLGMYNTTVV